MNTDLKLLIDFVSGEMEPKAFESKLYASNTMENYLSDMPDYPRIGYFGDGAYLFLISQDYDDPGAALNAHHVVQQILKRKGADFNSSDRFERLYDLIQDAQPKWLDVSPKFIAAKYFSIIKHLPRKDAKKKLRSYLLRDFKFIKNHPKWLQSPKWPIQNESPMVFLGQINIEEYFHDTAAAYVFYDPYDGHTETIIQTV